MSIVCAYVGPPDAANWSTYGHSAYSGEDEHRFRTNVNTWFRNASRSGLLPQGFIFRQLPQYFVHGFHPWAGVCGRYASGDPGWHRLAYCRRYWHAANLAIPGNTGNRLTIYLIRLTIQVNKVDNKLD